MAVTASIDVVDSNASTTSSTFSHKANGYVPASRPGLLNGHTGKPNGHATPRTLNGDSRTSSNGYSEMLNGQAAVDDEPASPEPIAIIGMGTTITITSLYKTCFSYTLTNF